MSSMYPLPALDAPNILGPETPVCGAVSAHYTVCLKRSGYKDFEVGNIDTLEDAERLANALTTVTSLGIAHVIEHKFTETTIGVYGWNED